MCIDPFWDIVGKVVNKQTNTLLWYGLPRVAAKEVIANQECKPEGQKRLQ